jgi:phage shock protein PspC (stress-responsive transcriptional regulator)
MERVVTINLNGNAYQLEEPAYDALRAYLGRAEAALAANPDKGEIVRDLEQAIADKCATHLGAGKSVVNAAEMARVLEEMGPVEGDSTATRTPNDESAGASEPPRRKLYRIKDGAQISGVCAGLGAYFDLDANIVRLLFIVAALFTSGAFILVYVAMMFFVPSAHTSAEWAAAHGMPFNAQEVIERAKREYQNFAEGTAKDWRASWRAQRQAWREDMRAQRHAWRGASAASAPAPAVGYATRVFAGLLAFVLSIVTAALLIGFIVALFSLLSVGAVFSWAPPADLPIWLAVIVLAIAYAAIAAPLAHLRRSSYAAASGYRDQSGGADGALTFAAIVAGGVLAYQFIPDFRAWMGDLLDLLRAFDF